MTADEIIEKVEQLIRTYVDVGANLHQDPYKRDFFKLCQAAHAAGYHQTTSSPRLSTDALHDAIAARLSQHEDQKRREGLKELCMMWREWLYTLDNI